MPRRCVLGGGVSRLPVDQLLDRASFAGGCVWAESLLRLDLRGLVLADTGGSSLRRGAILHVADVLARFLAFVMNAARDRVTLRSTAELTRK